MLPLRFGLVIAALFCLLASTRNSFGQADSTATSVYKQAEPSVFLVYLEDAQGKTEALGSAFVVASRLLVTNAHVVESGKPVLAIGPVRIPVKVQRRDLENDLALLSVEVDLPPALPLENAVVLPGERVFAIGSPEGLEKTISDGIISAHRKYNNRDLIQITTPISHGSSGGPVLDSAGKVVGVTVAFLDSGQNLNFAVPSSYVAALLHNPQPTATVSATSGTLVSQVKNALETRNSDKLFSRRGQSLSKG